MTTNQTIDGVPREDFTDIASAARCMTATTGTEGWGNAVKCFSMLCTPYAVIRMTDEIERLRALLDKEVSGDSRAPLPQGEPVELDEEALYEAWRKSNLGYVRPFNKYEWSAWLARARIAERPAPVAVVLPERKSVNTHNSHDWDEGHADGWVAYDTELKRLNPSL